MTLSAGRVLIGASVHGIAGQYWFWLLSIAILCFVLERIWPWRRGQHAFRAGFLQDVFWLVFNGHFAALGLALASGWLLRRLGVVLDGLHIPRPESIHLLAAASAARLSPHKVNPGSGCLGVDKWLTTG